MEIEQVVREVTVRGQVQGMDQVARAYNQVADAADRTATVTEKTTKAQASAEAAVEKLRLRYQDGYRQQQQYAEAQATYQRAVDQGRITQVAAAAELANVQAKLEAQKKRLEEASKGQTAYGKTVETISDKAKDLTRDLGPMGSALAAIGPVGIAVGAAVGVAVIAMDKLKEQANEAAQWASDLQNAANVIGLNTTQIQALNEAASDVGVTAGDNVAAFEKFTVALGELRTGSGSLYTELLKVNPALVNQLSVAKDAATGWNLLAQAYSQADKQQQALIARAAFGRGGAAVGGVLLATANAGGISGLANENAISQQQIQQWATLRTEINSATEAAAHNFQSIFTTEVLERENNFAKGMLKISQSAREFALSEDLKSFISFVTNPIVGGILFGAAVGAGGGALIGGVGAIPGAVAGAIAGGVAGAVTNGVADHGAKGETKSSLPPPPNFDATFAAVTKQNSDQVTASLGVQAAQARALISALGSLATAQERLDATTKQLNADLANHTVTQETYDRAIAGARLDALISQQSSYVNALGQSAPVADVVYAKQLQLQKLQLQNPQITDAVIESQLALTREQALGTTQIKAQIDATAVQTATMGMSAGEAAAFTAKQTLLNEAIRNHKSLTEQDIAEIDRQAAALGKSADAAERAKVASQIKFQKDTLGLSSEDVQIAVQLKGIYPDVATALSSVEAQQIRVANANSQLADGFREVGKAIVTAFVTGKNVSDALVSSLDSIANKLADSGFNNLLDGALRGDPLQAGQGALQLGASALISAFTGDQKAKKELQEAQAQWAKMAGEVTKFNQAAAGVDLGPLTNELQSLFSSFQTLEEAARKAKDETSRGQLADTLRGGISRVVQEFIDGGDTLSPLQKAIKGVNDEAAGLKDTLLQIGSANHWDLSNFGPIDAAVKAQIEKLVRDATDTLTSGLSSRLNTALGKTYLNDATALLKQHATDLSTAAELGNDPAILAQISATFAAETQKIVQDAGLVGDQFQDFITLFPDLAGVVHEATVDITDSIKTISEYLQSLQVGSNSILSPQEQLAAAQSQFNQQLTLAQGGNADAIGTITKYADQLLGQAKSYFASSDGYTDIFRAVTAALSGLTGSSGASYSATAPSSATATSSTISALTPVVSNGTAAANDNGAHFAQQTSTLVQAIAAAASAEVAAIGDLRDVLQGELRAVRGSIESKSGRTAMRPGDRADRKVGT